MKQMIAPCGINCGICDIRLMTTDSSAAERVVAWYKTRGWLHENEGVELAIERKMYCNGCPGDREIHWDPDCHILKCCIDEKHIENCSQCKDFACDNLKEWASMGEKYTKALSLLREMRSNTEGGNL